MADSLCFERSISRFVSFHLNLWLKWKMVSVEQEFVCYLASLLASACCPPRHLLLCHKWGNSCGVTVWVTSLALIVTSFWTLSFTLVSYDFTTRLEVVVWYRSICFLSSLEAQRQQCSHSTWVTVYLDWLKCRPAERWCIVWKRERGKYWDGYYLPCHMLLSGSQPS